MATEQMTAQVVVTVEKWSVKAAEQELARLQSPTWLKFAADLWDLRKQLQIINGQIRQAQKAGDFTAELQLRGNAETIKKQITIANRELTNFMRTGSTETSALWKLFEALGNKIGGPVWSVVSNLGWATGSMKSFMGAALTWVGVLGVAAWFTTLGVKAIFLGDKLEQASISFEVMLWSAEKAKLLLRDLTEFAKKTPFEILGIRDTAKQLLAFGIDSEKLIPTLKALGDVAAGTGTSLDRIGYAYWQVRSIWKLMGTELRQFTEAWVPLLAELARMYWVNEDAARQMVTDGLIRFADVEEAFKNMTSEWGKFYDLMQRQSKTFTGIVSNMKDSMNQFFEWIGKSLIPVAKLFAQALGYIVTWLQKLSENTWLVNTVLGVLWVALTAAAIYFAPVVAAVVGITWAITALAGVIWNSFIESIDAVSPAMDRMKASIDSLTDKVSTGESKMEELSDKINQLTEDFGAGYLTVEQYEKRLAALKAEQIKVTDQFGIDQKQLQDTQSEYENASQLIEQHMLILRDLDQLVENGTMTAEQAEKQRQISLASLRVLRGVTILVTDAQWQQTEVARENIYVTAKLNEWLSKLSTAKSIKEFNALRAELIANAQAALKLQMILANTALSDKAQAEASNNMEAAWKAFKKYLEISNLIDDTARQLEDMQKATYSAPVSKSSGGGGKSANQTLKDQLKEKEQLQKDALESTKNVLEEEIKAQKDALKETEKSIDALSDAIKKFDDINKKIADVGADAEWKIAARFNTIVEKIQDTKEKLSDFTDAQKQLAMNLWTDTLTNMAWDTTFQIGWTDVTVKDLREILKLQKELSNLQAEQALAKANTTDAAIATDNLSETQKIINEAAARKKDLEDQKADIEAKLWLKEDEAAGQLAILEKSKEDQQNTIDAYTEVVKTAEAEITAVTKKNTSERIAQYALEEARLRSLIALRMSAGNGGGWSGWTVNNTVNNSPNVTVNANVSSDVDVNKLGNTLSKKITLSSKWIN